MSEPQDPSIIPLGTDPVPYQALFVSRSPSGKLRNRTPEEVLAKCEKFIQENPGIFTPQLIIDMKYAKMKRPEWISSADWMGTVLRIEPIHELMCYMAAWGMQNSEIAKAVARNPLWVKQFLECSQGKTRMEQIQLRIWGQSPKKWIAQILPAAIKVCLDIMLDPTVKAATRLEAANKFIDREMGKPLQKIEHEDSLVRKIYDMLDQRGNGAAEPIDVSPEEPQEIEEVAQELATAPIEKSPGPQPAVKDKVDAWIDSTLDKI